MKTVLWTLVLSAVSFSAMAKQYNVACARVAKADIQISQEWLRTAVDAQAKSVNYFRVNAYIVSSYIHNRHSIDCHYQNEGGDAGNMVYNIPCSNARRNYNGYDHSYTCTTLELGKVGSKKIPTGSLK